ncbi:MAG: hypothetical protein OEV78_09585 [Spirochaetia bacterium]|nr:hypothetical protein [Spirochaetia bacterium]
MLTDVSDNFSLNNLETPIVSGKFSIVFHFYRSRRELNHLDIFLLPPDYNYLISYKLPKNKLNEPAVLQKNHHLKYLTYEGTIHNDQEKVKIIKKGFFITNSWTISEQPCDLVHFSWYNKAANIDNQQIRENMWKKTDFKIAIDEIKLYEVIDEKNSSKKLPNEKVIEKSAIEEPVTKVENEIQNEIKISNVPLTLNPDVNVTQVNHQNTLLEQSQINQKMLDENKNALINQFQIDKKIEFVPVQELILEDSGKATEEYKAKS